MNTSTGMTTTRRTTKPIALVSMGVGTGLPKHAVESGAYIYIQNYDWGEAIRLSGQIIQLDDPPWPNMQWDEDAFYYDEETLDYYRELFEE